jgi:alpha-1,4-digalacturonate transport system substrate-binding protein
MSQLTMTGPYVNKTLFEQAKVAMPGAKDLLKKVHGIHA